MAQDDDGPIQLTPEQQKQLAMIESMPLTMETEISQEEWAQKTPEEKERIMGKFPSLCTTVLGVTFLLINRQCTIEAVSVFAVRIKCSLMAYTTMWLIGICENVFTGGEILYNFHLFDITPKLWTS